MQADLLKKRFPGRAKQIRLLHEICGQPNEPSSNTLFVHGAPSTGKTSVLKSLFKPYMDVNLAVYVNCNEVYSPRILFDRIINGLAGWTPNHENGFTSYTKCDTIGEFEKAFKSVIEQDEVQERQGLKRYLIIDNAEQLRTMKPSLLFLSLINLHKITGVCVDVILVSSITWDHFEDFSSATMPFMIFFPTYTQEQIMHILALDRPEGTDVSFYISFIHIIYQSFHKGCRHLNELRYIAGLLYPKYIEPIKYGNVDPSEKGKLHKHLEGALEDFARQLYLREMSSLEWEKEPTTRDRVTKLAAVKHRSISLELPYYTKFLLIASFLASYNPAKLDQRYFTKANDTKSKKKGGGTRKGRVSQEKTRQQLLGPKSFPVERMLAIFYAIIDDPVESNVDIQCQIMTLVNLRLLLRVTTADNLDGMKCKCNVAYETIAQVARKVHLNIDHYLHDWE